VAVWVLIAIAGEEDDPFADLVEVKVESFMLAS
jgi:hypothetical protein